MGGSLPLAPLTRTASVKIRIHESSILGFVVRSNELQIRFEYISMFIRTSIRIRILERKANIRKNDLSFDQKWFHLPTDHQRKTLFSHFARILNFYDYRPSKTHVYLGLEYLSTVAHIFKI